LIKNSINIRKWICCTLIRKLKENYRFTSMVVWQGNIFLGTKSHGLLWINPLHLRRIFTKNNSSILDNRIKKVLLDSTHRIVLLHPTGLSFGYLKGQRIHWRSLRLAHFPFLNDIAVEKTGNLWLATEDGLYAGSDGKWYKFGKSEGLEVSNIKKILLLENKGKLWVWGKGFWGKNQLYNWDGSRWQKSDLPRDMEIRDFFTWKETLWLATNKGIFKLYKGHWTKFSKEDGVQGEDTYFIAKGANTIYFEGYGEGKVFLGEMDKYFLK